MTQNIPLSLSRGCSQEEAENRIPSHPKISTVCGDSSKGYLGMPPAWYNNLKQQVDVIYNCAAEVNNIKPLEQLYDNNVQSVVNLYRFSVDTKLKTFLS